MAPRKSGTTSLDHFVSFGRTLPGYDAENAVNKATEYMIKLIPRLPEVFVKAQIDDIYAEGDFAQYLTWDNLRKIWNGFGVKEALSLAIRSTGKE